MPAGTLKQQLAASWINIRQGIRLVFCLPLERDRFRISLDQAVLLIIIDMALSFLRDLAYSFPHPNFNQYAFPAATFSYLGMLLAIYLVDRLVLRQDRVLALYVVISSSFPAVLLIHVVLYEILQATGLLSIPWLYVAVSVLLLAWIFFRAINLFMPDRKFRILLAIPVLFVVWIWPSWALVGNVNYWYFDSGKDPYAGYRKLDVEKIFYSQPDLLDESLAALKPQRNDQTDLYFIGFAGWARQDVFIKETRYVQGLFDHRFDTEGRSLSLINNLQTYQTQPLATATNLQRSLKTIGQKMDPDQDMLVLFMTSHGGRSHELGVDFWPMRLNNVKPENLKQYLDAAEIKWRVLFVSACSSRGFIEKLKDPYTFIATASAADRRSFGCDDANDFTYFGEALFQQQLTHRDSFIEAFDQAKAAIQEREQKENITPSRPQLYVGEKIRPRLEKLAERFASQERVYPLEAGTNQDEPGCKKSEQECH